MRRILRVRGRRCEDCGATEGRMDVDHILSREAGGTDDDANLRVRCVSCHSRKTARRDGRWGR